MNQFLLSLLLVLPVPAPIQQRSGVVTGILRTDKGEFLEGVRVAVMPAGAGVADSLLESIGQTDKDGRYRLENVSPGNYLVVFGRSLSLQYHPGLPGPEGATTIAVTAGSTINVPDLVLKRLKVTGRVVDAATGVGRHIASLAACCEYSFSEMRGGTVLATGNSFAASVNDDGTFGFEALPSGSFTLQALDPGIISQGQPLRVGNTDMTDVVIKVSSGVAVDGEIVDRLGMPVSGVISRLRPKPANTDSHSLAVALGPAQTGTAMASATGYQGTMNAASFGRLAASSFATPLPPDVQVGPDGRFAMRRVLPGIYMLDVNAPGGNSVEREIEVGPFGLTNLRVEMPFTHFVGRIAAADGGLLPKVGSVRLISTGADGRIFYSYPDEAGRFSMLLAAGSYRISTDGQGHSVRSISNPEFVFDGVNKPDIVITVE
jgi:hypothetical protein